MKHLIRPWTKDRAEAWVRAEFRRAGFDDCLWEGRRLHGLLLAAIVRRIEAIRRLAVDDYRRQAYLQGRRAAVQVKDKGGAGVDRAFAWGHSSCIMPEEEAK